MAQSIHLMGADWPDVPSVVLPKTSGGSAVFADPTVTTATANDVASGKVFIDASGNVATGTSTGGGGGGTPTPNEDADVIFIDYDGTVLYSYSTQEALALTEMPPNPSHSGLIAQGWNYTLSELKEQCQLYPNIGKATVGQLYTTDDGNTRIYISILENEPPYNMALRFSTSMTNGVTIDWGDGTVETSNNNTSINNYTHQYSQYGDYTISLKVTLGKIQICGEGSATDGSGYSIFGTRKYTTFGNRIKHIELGDNVSLYNAQSAFHSCYNLETITIPNTITDWPSYLFYFCFSLKSVTVPRGITSIPEYCMHYNTLLKYVSFPIGITSIGQYAFDYCASLMRCDLPKGLETVGERALYFCALLKYIILPNTVTTVGARSFAFLQRMEELIISKNLVIIGDYAFYNNNVLKEVKFECDPSTLGTYVFYYCANLRSVVLGDGFSRIGKYMFYCCFSLKKITIPASVSTIDTYAFNTTYITEFHLESETPPTLASTGSLPKMTAYSYKIYVPYSADHSVLEAYKTATNWSTFASRMVEEEPT